MGYSIQENLKKINSWLNPFDLLSIFATTVILFGFVMFLYYKKMQDYLPVTYIEASGVVSNTGVTDARPFASVNGKTYTFSWCQGGGVILEKNKVYFKSEVEAKNSGRTLSKLCQK